MNTTTRIGIFCPDWILAWHNTDHKIVKMFSRLEEFAELETEFIASNGYTLSYNFNRLLQRVVTLKNPLLDFRLRKSAQSHDLVYHYGAPVAHERFYKKLGSSPFFITTGFMTDRFMENAFGSKGDRRQEADDLARSLAAADMIHFHTEGGRERFLHYRPEFREKAVSIPFFLPNIRPTQTNLANADKVKILFVGNDGVRKGLHELISALDFLGTMFLKSFNVEVTVVSADRPRSIPGLPVKWHKVLPHNEVLQLMAEASIFVLVPKSESYGLVLIEAMNAGCAVLTDDDDTRQEIIGDAGVLLKSGAVANVAKGLKRLIEDRDERMRMAERGQSRVRERFLPEIVAKQYHDKFQSLIKSSN